jgi:hypothetical protein
MDTPKRLTPQEFFDLAVEGGTMTAAQLATGITYSTIHHARKGGTISVDTAKALSRWSRALVGAVAAGVCIDAARALGLDDEDPAETPAADEGRPSMVA